MAVFCQYWLCDWVCQKTIDVVLEFATPLLSLYEMHSDVLADLSELAMKTERDKFREVLTRILCYKHVRARCQDRYLIVNYRGAAYLSYQSYALFCLELFNLIQFDLFISGKTAHKEKPVDRRQTDEQTYAKRAITSKIKHAIKVKTSPARLAQLLQPSLAFCFSLQPMTVYRPGLDSTPSLAAS